MTHERIGIVGGSGAVGRVVARRLSASGYGRLRLGGRRLDPALRVLRDDLGCRGEAVIVDVDDQASLERFCAGCRVVVNCAGPSRTIVDRVMRAAVSHDADYVDPGGDEPFAERLAERPITRAHRCAIISAGMQPGLSGLLPRALVHRDAGRPTGLTTYVRILDRLTAASAGDYLAGLGESESLAAWSEGRRASRAAARLVDVELPFFSGRVTAHPFVSGECERVARRLGLEHARWYNVFDGGHLLAALSRLSGLGLHGVDREAGVKDIARAAALDVVGRTPYLLLLFELESERDGRTTTRSLMLRATEAAGLTGAVAALAVEAVLAGRVAAGVHFAADVLDAGWILRRLNDVPCVSAIQYIEGPLGGAASSDEGVL